MPEEIFIPSKPAANASPAVPDSEAVLPLVNATETASTPDATQTPTQETTKAVLPTPEVSQNWLDSIKQSSQSGFSEPEWAASIVHGRSRHEPLYHARTHNIPVALLHFRSYTPSLLDLFVHFASHAACSLGIPISRPAKLPTQRSLWTVPRSPFVHKKAQENFERRVHKRLVKAWDADPTVVERWVRYLEKNAMPGVGMRIVRWERAPVGVGEKVYIEARKGVRERVVTDKERMKRLGEQIVQKELAPTQTVATTVATSS
ncbi:ribosomal protein S10 [Neolentinus lepideus HHB14362 ss-1]|uniref:Small ribosomal subunit protein uS10m n=1 Tax=Neolentinus lepideus HHB14362 ss-1 TaxID=1314782 RepID=A0A165P9P2_9AGAM|nr:ribosomal protein S10 [Neolentinus lepideus HHB14362 ss-1]